MTDDLLQKAAERLQLCQNELANARERLVLEPTEANAGAVNIAIVKLEAAQAALQKARIEQDRAAELQKSDTYKADLKRMTEWEREADKLLTQIAGKVTELTKQLDAIQELAKKHNKLALHYGKAGFLHARKISRVWELNQQLKAWQRAVQAAQISNQQPKIVNRPPILSDAAKMLKERYPDAKG